MREEATAVRVPQDDMCYEVLTSERVTPSVVELRLRPRTAPLSYRAGQYVLLCDAAGALPQRSYSIANAPRLDGYISLLVTRVEGGAISTWVHERLRPGDEVSLSGPYGTFLPAPDTTSPLLLLAGGSGLAPMRAIAQASLAEHPSRPVSLFFSARTMCDAIDCDVFGALQRSHTSFRYLLTLTRDSHVALHGRIPDLLPTAIGSTAAQEVFIAGSPGFVAACATSVRSLGAHPFSVHTEPFFLEPQPWLVPPSVQPSP